MGAILLLRPHCESQAESSSLPSLSEFLQHGVGGCANFPILDPFTQETPRVKAGDILDLDLVLYHSNQTPISRMRAWLNYDPMTLKGDSVDVSANFPQITPGEANFQTEKGFVAIGGSATEGKEPQTGIMTIARIRFTVTQTPVGGTPLSFYDLKTDTDGHTFIAEKANQTTNILPPQLGVLLVQGEPAAPAGNEGAGNSSSSTPGHGAAPEQTDFSLLQPQNLRAGTEGTTIYVAWDPLRSADLLGYNVYYGTEKGRYLQRHSVDPGSTTLALRGFVAGTTYYLAVRGVNTENIESAFSQEVSLTVGDPRSSTAPLSIPGNLRTPPGNPLKGSGTGQAVPGASGSPSWTLILIALSAATAVLFAIRRQGSPRITAFATR